MIDMWRRKVVLGTSFIQISEIDTDSNSSLLFVHRNNIQYPFRQGYRIDKSCLQKFFDFSFDSHSLSRMDLSQFLPNRSGHRIGFDLVDYNG